MNRCAYCLEPRDSSEGWHGCPPSRDAAARIDDLITSMSRVADGVSLQPAPVKDNVYLGRAVKGMKAWDQTNERTTR